MGKARPKSKGGCRPAKQSPYQRAPRAPGSGRRGPVPARGGGILRRRALLRREGIPDVASPSGGCGPSFFGKNSRYWKVFSTKWNYVGRGTPRRRGTSARLQWGKRLFSPRPRVRGTPPPPCVGKGRSKLLRVGGTLTDNPKGECLLETLSPAGGTLPMLRPMSKGSRSSPRAGAPSPRAGRVERKPHIVKEVLPFPRARKSSASPVSLNLPLCTLLTHVERFPAGSPASAARGTLFTRGERVPLVTGAALSSVTLFLPRARKGAPHGTIRYG